MIYIWTGLLTQKKSWSFDLEPVWTWKRIYLKIYSLFIGFLSSRLTTSEKKPLIMLDLPRRLIMSKLLRRGWQIIYENLNKETRKIFFFFIIPQNRSVFTCLCQYVIFNPCIVNEKKNHLFWTMSKYFLHCQLYGSSSLHESFIWNFFSFTSYSSSHRVAEHVWRTKRERERELFIYFLIFYLSWWHFLQSFSLIFGCR